MPTDDVSIRQADYGSALYRQTVALRDEILRRPLGMRLGDEELQKDAADIHIAALDGEKIAGCLVLTPLPGNVLKMRQVAVADGRQGVGIGRKMVLWTEDFARTGGFHKITLHARETVVGFYEKLGYKKTGKPFIEVTIPHQAMEKQIEERNRT